MYDYKDISAKKSKKKDVVFFEKRKRNGKHENKSRLKIFSTGPLWGLFRFAFISPESPDILEFLKPGGESAEQYIGCLKRQMPAVIL